MRVVIHPSAEAASRGLADFLARMLRRQPSVVLALPTGRTPIALYRELIQLHERGRADFRRATTFNLDEFAGLSPRDPCSYHAFMRRHLFDEVNLSPRRIHFLDGTPTDVVFEIGRDEPPVLHWIGLPTLKDGHRQWFDLAARPLEEPVPASPRGGVNALRGAAASHLHHQDAAV